MEAIKGVYKTGECTFPENRGREKEVPVLFENSSRKKRSGLSKKEVQKLVGIISCGGDALADTENLYL